MFVVDVLPYQNVSHQGPAGVSYDAYHLVISPIIDVASTFIFPIASSSCAMAFTLVYQRSGASELDVGTLVSSGIDHEKKKHFY